MVSSTIRSSSRIVCEPSACSFSSYRRARPRPPAPRARRGADHLLEVLARDRGRDRPSVRPRQDALEVPLLGEDLLRRQRAGRSAATTSSTISDRLVLEVLALEDLLALLVDHLALGVHHVVVLQDVLASLEVQLLDLLLRALDGLGDHLGRDGLVLRPLQPLHDRADPVGGEHPHQVVLERQVEQRLARVALPAGPAAELVVDPARLVALGARGRTARRPPTTSSCSASVCCLNFR